MLPSRHRHQSDPLADLLLQNPTPILSAAAMGKAKADKDRNNKLNIKKQKQKLGLKPKKKKQQQKNPIPDHDPILFGDGNGISAAASDDDDYAPTPTPEQIQRLLEPYTKDQLLAFLVDTAVANPALLARIRSVADTDVSHRKIFVHGFGWDTTNETLMEAFQPYGPIEDCKVVIDRATGRAKGFGFVLFKTRAGAVKALKEPQKKINNRLTNSQLASMGSVPTATTSGPHGNAEGRRVYVSNVHADAAPDKLKALFAKFGEIEAGPIGFDMNTGKSRGFALFVYKTQEGAAKALEEPYKMFEGHQLHCQKATDPSQKGKGPALAAAATTPAALLAAAQQPVLAAVAAAQNLALYSQNPAYAALLGQNPLLAAAALNPAAAAALLNPTAAGLLAPQGQLYGGAGIGGRAPSVLGAYGSQGDLGLQVPQSYQGSHYGQPSSARSSSSFGGYPSYL